jgi:undecaprenyl-diphosphatase
LLAAFTYIGEGGAVWIAAAIIMTAVKKTRTGGIYVAVALVYEFIANEVLLKNIIARTRPFVLNPNIDTIVSQPTSYSFPSGHSCSAFAAATAIFMYNKRAGAIAYAVSAVIGFSRCYFYIHFPTDVICGAIFGVILGYAAVGTVKVLLK